jgi:hypothetical protein
MKTMRMAHPKGQRSLFSKVFDVILVGFVLFGCWVIMSGAFALFGNGG